MRTTSFKTQELLLHRTGWMWRKHRVSIQLWLLHHHGNTLLTPNLHWSPSSSIRVMCERQTQLTFWSGLARTNDPSVGPVLCRLWGSGVRAAGSSFTCVFCGSFVTFNKRWWFPSSCLTLAFCSRTSAPAGAFPSGVDVVSYMEP